MSVQAVASGIRPIGAGGDKKLIIEFVWPNNETIIIRYFSYSNESTAGAADASVEVSIKAT